MTEPGRILIADDEETFLFSTADLLRREGYHCDCAADAPTAAELLRRGVYDLLIADIKMPGNPKLELIHELPRIVEGLRVILVTGYPSLHSAIQSIQLPVAAYLVKPVDFPILLEEVGKAIRGFRVQRLVREARRRIEEWHQDLQRVEKAMTDRRQAPSGSTVDAFAELTFRNILDSLSDLKRLARSSQATGDPAQPCHLFACPRLAELTGAVSDAIKTLERTRTAFKSKDIAQLRKRLESLLSEDAAAEAPVQPAEGQSGG